MEIILASASPRRSELIKTIGIERFTVLPAETEEAPDASLSPAEAVPHIALSKARDVAARTDGDRLIIAADTLVFLDGTPLGKPEDEEEARAMLRALSGRTHTVVTGVALIRDGRELTAAEETKVTFRPLSQREIDWYIATGEPMDKAGAYGAQGKGAVLVEKIDGDFFNVMGLPIALLVQMMRALGTDFTELAR